MSQLYSRLLPQGAVVVIADNLPGCEQIDRISELSVIRLPLQFESWGALGWRRGAHYLRVFSQLHRITREQSIRAVHASNCLPDGFLAWMLNRRFGLPYVVFVHGEELNVASKSRELAFMTRRVFRSAQLVIANSHNSARLLRENWPVAPERLRVMHPGVNTDCYQPARRDRCVRKRLAWGDRPVILTVGRLQKRKGHEQVLQALPTIRRLVPDVLYAIVGDGEERARLEQIASALSLQDCVKLHGEVGNEDLVAAYQQCDVFAMPNREVDGDFEGFGIVFLEAQACAKPVIAGDSGGAAEAMREPETGFIVRQDYPEELPRALIQLLTDEPLRRRMGAAGREWVVANFDWRILVKQASQLFSTVCSNGEVVHRPDMPVPSTDSRTAFARQAPEVSQIG
jgi:phosphatidylinositol alpha-1,6-mannosyltransferase